MDVQGNSSSWYPENAASLRTTPSKDFTTASDKFDESLRFSSHKNCIKAAESANIRSIVQELIQKRKEERSSHGSSNKNIVAIQKQTVSAEKTYPFIYAEPANAVRQNRFNGNTSNWKADTLTTHSKYCEPIKEAKTKRRIAPNASPSPKRKSVFERLYSNASHKLLESRLNSATAASARYKRTSSQSSIRVEDRLIEYKRQKLRELEKKRALALELEAATMQSSPRILNNRLTQRQTSPYNSILERFEALEKERQRKRFKMAADVIQKELSQMKRSPEINEKSRKISRQATHFQEWEARRKMKLDLIKQRNKKREMETMCENMSRTVVSFGSIKYLEQRNASKERVENLLLRYGEESKLKTKVKAETNPYPFRPTINKASRSHCTFNPYSTYQKQMSTKDEYLSERDTDFGTNEFSMRKVGSPYKTMDLDNTEKLVKTKMIKGLFHTMKEELHEDPYERFLPKSKIVI